MSILEELARTIGGEAAQKLIADFAGTRLYIPHLPGPEDPIVRSIGLAAALKLAHIYGGDRIDVPNPALLQARILAMRAKGYNIEAIARELHCTERRVYQVLAAARRSNQAGNHGFPASRFTHSARGLSPGGASQKP